MNQERNSMLKIALTFYEKSGRAIEVITSSESSSSECSMSGVDVYVVSKKIGGP